MSNTRTLNEVKPTKSLLFAAMECEEKAAHIQTQAVRILKDNIDTCKNNQAMEIGYRYLQSSRGKITTSMDAILAGFFAILTLMDCCKHPDILKIASVIFYSASVPPNISNTVRYQQTESACAQWLQKKFGEQEFKKIQKMPYNKQGLDSLTLFLNNKNIPATAKEHKDIEFIQNAFAAFTFSYFIPILSLLILMYEAIKLINKNLFSPLPRESNRQFESRFMR